MTATLELAAMAAADQLQHWNLLAACDGHDPELFFPVGNKAPAQAQAERAKAVCQGCPVRSACLNWAIETGQDHGIWGGMDEDERRVLKQRRRH